VTGADVVVIGGGIVGCAAAYELAAAGADDVVLLERADAVGTGSTGACAGGFRHQFTTPVNVRLSQASIPMIVGFGAAHGLPLDVSQDGYLFVVRDDTTWGGFLDGVRDQRALGVEVDVLEPADAGSLIPGLDLTGVVGATFGPRDGIADPAGLTQGYATIARRAGARIELGVEVVGLLAGDGRIRGVRTTGGDVAASAVVLAAGAWSGALAATAGLDLPIVPVARTVVTTGAFPGVPTRRTLVIDMPSTFYFHREADGVLMGMGGDDVPTFDTGVDEGFVADRLLPRAVEVFPPVVEAPIRSSWAGLYEMTPDHHPVLGATPVDGLYVAAGFSGHGFQQGPIAGKLIAELVVGGAATTVDIEALAFDRFARGVAVDERHVV
jgi:glycine/D-amino acid oxidase-like deaminating enzyme